MSTPTAIAASQLITDALRLINVIMESETPSAEQQASGIRTLNEMLSTWAADGLRLSYIPVGTVTNTLTVPDGAVKGIKFCLAIDLAATYGATVSAEVAKGATDGMAVIQKICARTPNFQSDIPAPSDWSWYGSFPT